MLFGSNFSLADQAASGPDATLKHLLHDLALSIHLLVDVFVVLLAGGANPLHAFFLQLAL